MKKVQKTALGLAGLLIVAIVTVFAVFLPGPGALAATSSVTDTIVVTVLSATPNVSISNPKNGDVFVSGEQEITYGYELMSSVTVTLKYTDREGNTRTDVLANFSPSEEHGSGSLPINLLNDYGYGDFVLTVSGVGIDSVPDEEIIRFSLVPVTGEAKEDDKSGDVNVDLNYDEDSDEIDYININVYDKDGNLIEPLSPVKVPKPQKGVTLPFSDYNLPDGKYTIEIVAYDSNDEPLHEPYLTTIDYKAPSEEGEEEEDIPVPNTGMITGGNSISQSDYIISGLIVFALAGICGIVVVGKNRQGKRRR